MSRDDIPLLLIPIIVIVSLLYVLIMSPENETNLYKDQMIVCNTEDQWGLNNAKTTCYKVEEIK